MTNLINLNDHKEKLENDKSLAVKLLISCVDVKMDINDLQSTLKQIYQTVRELGADGGVAIKSGELKTLTKKQIKDSIHDDYLICFEDGVKLKMLKRHLRSNYQITFDEYKEKWGLPFDYPAVCKNYSERRSEMAKASGLGKHMQRGSKKAKVGEQIDIEDLPPIHLVKTKTKPVQVVTDGLDL